MIDTNIPIISKYLIDAIEEVKKTLTGRSTGYKVQPVTYIPIGDLIAQISIKVERARQSTGIDKQIDEATDIVGYSVWLLARLNEEKDKINSRPDVEDEQRPTETSVKGVLQP